MALACFCANIARGSEKKRRLAAARFIISVIHITELFRFERRNRADREAAIPATDPLMLL